MSWLVNPDEDEDEAVLFNAEEDDFLDYEDNPKKRSKRRKGRKSKKAKAPRKIKRRKVHRKAKKAAPVKVKRKRHKRRKHRASTIKFIEAPKKATKKVEKPIEVEKPVIEEVKTEETQDAKEVETAEGEEDKISLEQIREAFADKVNTGDNRMKLKNELTRLDAPNLVKLDKAHYADFLNFVNAL